MSSSKRSSSRVALAALGAALLGSVSSSEAQVTSCPATAIEGAPGSQNGVYYGSWGRDYSAGPGTVLACQTIQSSDLWRGDGSAQAFVGRTKRAITYRYLTRDAANRTVPATAMLLVPNQASTAPTRLMAIATGTVGLKDSCTPSLSLRRGKFASNGKVDYYLSKGLTVVVVDYIGLGTELAADGFDHPYLEGPSAGHVVLDALRAAQQLPGANGDGSQIPAHLPVGVSGVSQGAHAALWATVLASSYGQVNLNATVAGASPVDLKKALQQVDGSFLELLYGYGTAGYLNATDPETRNGSLQGIIKPEGQALMERMRNTCASELTIQDIYDALIVHFPINELFDTTKLFADPKFSRWLEKNSLRYNGVPRFAPTGRPVFGYHGWWDEVAPFAEASTFYRTDWGASTNLPNLWGQVNLARVPVVFQEAAGGDHLTTSALEANDAGFNVRYAPYEWLYDGLFNATRTAPDLTP